VPIGALGTRRQPRAEVNECRAFDLLYEMADDVIKQFRVSFAVSRRAGNEEVGNAHQDFDALIRRTAAYSLLDFADDRVFGQAGASFLPANIRLFWADRRAHRLSARSPSLAASR
jgi:hypothetical protein